MKYHALERALPIRFQPKPHQSSESISASWANEAFHSTRTPVSAAPGDDTKMRTPAFASGANTTLDVLLLHLPSACDKKFVKPSPSMETLEGTSVKLNAALATVEANNQITARIFIIDFTAKTPLNLPRERQLQMRRP
jgi:hypothetical protein